MKRKRTKEKSVFGLETPDFDVRRAAARRVKDGASVHRLASVAGAHADDMRGFIDNGTPTLTPAVLRRLADWLAAPNSEGSRAAFEIPASTKPANPERARAITHSESNTAETLSPPALASLPAIMAPASPVTMQLDAPPCGTCGDLMVRNGSCYRCLTCGTTSGCS